MTVTVHDYFLYSSYQVDSDRHLATLSAALAAKCSAAQVATGQRIASVLAQAVG